MRVTSVPLWSNIFMLAIHVPIACLFVFTLDMDYLGAAYATITSTFITYLFLLLQLSYRVDIAEALFWPDKDSFRDWGNYLSIGGPIMVMLTVVLSSNEILMAFAGILGHIELAAASELTMINFGMNIMGESIMETSIIMTGNLIGENKVPLA